MRSINGLITLYVVFACIVSVLAEKVIVMWRLGEGQTASNIYFIYDNNRVRKASVSGQNNQFVRQFTAEKANAIREIRLDFEDAQNGTSTWHQLIDRGTIANYHSRCPYQNLTGYFFTFSLDS